MQVKSRWHRLLWAGTAIAILITIIADRPSYGFLVMSIALLIELLTGGSRVISEPHREEASGSASVPSTLIPVPPRGSARHEEPLPSLDNLSSDLLDTLADLDLLDEAERREHERRRAQ